MTPVVKRDVRVRKRCQRVGRAKERGLSGRSFAPAGSGRCESRVRHWPNAYDSLTQRGRDSLPRIELPLLSHRQIQPLVHSFATEISTRTSSCLPGTYPSLLTVIPPPRSCFVVPPLITHVALSLPPPAPPFTVPETIRATVRKTTMYIHLKSPLPAFACPEIHTCPFS